MIVEPNSPKAEEIFGIALPELATGLFQNNSAMPPYVVMQAAIFGDPSIIPDELSVLTGEEGDLSVLETDSQGYVNVNTLQWAATRDFAWSSGYAIWDQMADLGGLGQVGGREALGILSKNITAVRSIAHSLTQLPVGSMDAEMVKEYMVNMGFGLGMEALSAVGGIYGKIAAAVLGFAQSLRSIIKAQKEAEKLQEKVDQAVAYMQLPPLMQATSETDNWYCGTVVRAIMATGDWTPLFSPRFDNEQDGSSGDWFGAMRHGGMAFAPGEWREPTNSEYSVDEMGQPLGKFISAKYRGLGGVGLIPGTNRITSVIQVSLSKDAPSVKTWRDPHAGGAYPVYATMVQDVGDWYMTSARTATSAWNWAMKDGAPSLYKIDTHFLHERWRRYCQSGLRFIRERVTWELTQKGNPLMFMYGAAIACSIGAWSCELAGGTTANPLRSPLDLSPGVMGAHPRTSAFGIQSLLGPEMSEHHHFGGLSETFGCVMQPSAVPITPQGYLFAGTDRPPWNDPAWDDACLSDMYSAFIRFVLDDVRKRQLYFIKATPVCAYVRENWAAFRQFGDRDEEIADQDLYDWLITARKALLQHPIRTTVNLKDVPENEPPVPGFPGATYKEQLIESGVPPTPQITQLSAGDFMPAGDAPPPPVDPGGVPWEDEPAFAKLAFVAPGGGNGAPKKRKSGMTTGQKAAVAAAGVGGAYLIYRRYGQDMRRIKIPSPREVMQKWKA